MLHAVKELQLSQYEYLDLRAVALDHGPRCFSLPGFHPGEAVLYAALKRRGKAAFFVWGMAGTVLT